MKCIKGSEKDGKKSFVNNPSLSLIEKLLEIVKDSEGQ